MHDIIIPNEFIYVNILSYFNLFSDLKFCTIIIFQTVPRYTVRLKHSSNELNHHQAKVMGRGLPEKKPLPGVKSIILVASGKGGVGKTTTAGL